MKDKHAKELHAKELQALEVCRLPLSNQFCVADWLCPAQNSLGFPQIDFGPSPFMLWASITIIFLVTIIVVSDSRSNIMLQYTTSQQFIIQSTG